MPPKGDEDFVPKKKEGECVKVVVRVRPLSKKEIQDGHAEATKADEDSGRITCQNPQSRRRRAAQDLYVRCRFCPNNNAAEAV